MVVYKWATNTVLYNVCKYDMVNGHGHCRLFSQAEYNNIFAVDALSDQVFTTQMRFLLLWKGEKESEGFSNFVILKVSVWIGIHIYSMVKIKFYLS